MYFHFFLCFLQVLPEDMVVLAKPDPSDMVKAIQKAILMLPYIDPQDMHLRVSGFCFYILICVLCVVKLLLNAQTVFHLMQMKKLYSWHDVAKRTEIVYDRALRCPNQDLLERLSRYDELVNHFIHIFLVQKLARV